MNRTSNLAKIPGNTARPCNSEIVINESSVSPGDKDVKGPASSKIPAEHPNGHEEGDKYTKGHKESTDTSSDKHLTGETFTSEKVKKEPTNSHSVTSCPRNTSIIPDEPVVVDTSLLRDA